MHESAYIIPHLFEHRNEKKKLHLRFYVPLNNQPLHKNAPAHSDERQLFFTFFKKFFYPEWNVKLKKMASELLSLRD